MERIGDDADLRVELCDVRQMGEVAAATPLAGVATLRLDPIRRRVEHTDGSAVERAPALGCDDLDSLPGDGAGGEHDATIVPTAQRRSPGDESLGDDLDHRARIDWSIGGVGHVIERAVGIGMVGHRPSVGG